MGLFRGSGGVLGSTSRGNGCAWLVLRASGGGLEEDLPGGGVVGGPAGGAGGIMLPGILVVPVESRELLEPELRLRKDICELMEAWLAMRFLITDGDPTVGIRQFCKMNRKYTNDHLKGT